MAMRGRGPGGVQEGGRALSSLGGPATGFLEPSLWGRWGSPWKAETLPKVAALVPEVGGPGGLGQPG